jgi:hypothetical protein
VKDHTPWGKQHTTATFTAPEKNRRKKEKQQKIGAMMKLPKNHPLPENQRSAAP